jgi:hypothetical protein
MNSTQAFYAYCATLIALVLIATVAAVLVAMGRDVAALGMAALFTGLIGVLGTFKPSTNPTPKDDGE